MWVEYLVTFPFIGSIFHVFCLFIYKYFIARTLFAFKGIAHLNIKILVTLMLIKRWVKSFSPQNTVEVPREKGIAVTSQRIETNGDQVSNIKKI